MAFDCDVIILAGDIGVGQGAISAVQKIAEVHDKSEIIFVAGNHEFYKQNIGRQLENYNEAFENPDRIHFLENSSVEINGYKFLGCTLWTGFGALGWEHTREAMQQARLAIADFSVIETGDEYRKFTPQDAADCQQIIERYQPLLWCYGHNHLSDDIFIGQTHLISNQLGYPKEPYYSGYNPQKIIEVP